MIKAVIFDLDDTLISENEYIKSGFRVVARYIKEKYGIDEEIAYNELNNLSNADQKNVFNRFFEKRSIKYNAEDINKIVEIYKTHKPNIKFFEDVISTIKDLKDKGIKVGIISDGNANAQRLKLDAVNAFDIFDEIILTDELGKEFWKPNPKAFEIMKDRLNVEFNEMMYVGDNPEKDFYIGKYGVKTVRVCNKDGIYWEREYFEGVKEEARINKLSEILK